MVSPNWPSEEDPDYTPNFGGDRGGLETQDTFAGEVDVLREDFEDLVDED